MIVTSDYHISDNPIRQMEYDFCINKILENSFVDKVIFFFRNKKCKTYR